MTFSSLVFLCIFLPTVFLLHWVLPSVRLQNALLILASLLFYAFGEPVYVLLMIVCAFFNYLFALLLGRKKSKAAVTVAVIANLGMLGVFKYAGFVVESLNRIPGLSLPVPQIALPIGISFFTFQALSYVIDVHRGRVPAQRSFWRILLYVAFFPQLIAGPIVKYKDIAEQIEDRRVTLRAAAFGMRRFLFGLGKKVLIANTLAVAADHIFARSPAALNAPAAWLGLIAYTLQIYYDFSGYSDMAIGLGRMFGFTFLENFDFPYLAVSVREYWRRWHISLSSWFRDYVYIPLGGNRKGKYRTGLNKFLVFFLTGLWHGANWTFVVWGIYHGLFSLMEEVVPAVRKLPRFLGHIYAMLQVTLGFVIFRSDSLPYAMGYFKAMFTGFDLSPAANLLFLRELTPFFLLMFAAAVLLCAPVGALVGRLRAYHTRTPAERREQGVLFVLSFLVLLWCLIRLSGGSYNPFIYFRF